MKKIEYKAMSADFVPDVRGQFIVSTDCCRCGNRTMVAIDKDCEFDRSESDYWKTRYEDLMGSVNTLISDTEHRTGWNPHKEVFMGKLVKIRDRLAEENPGRYEI